MSTQSTPCEYSEYPACAGASYLVLNHAATAQTVVKIGTACVRPCADRHPTQPVATLGWPAHPMECASKPMPIQSLPRPASNERWIGRTTARSERSSFEPLWSLWQVQRVFGAARRPRRCGTNVCNWRELLAEWHDYWLARGNVAGRRALALARARRRTARRRLRGRGDPDALAGA